MSTEEEKATTTTEATEAPEATPETSTTDENKPAGDVPKVEEEESTATFEPVVCVFFDILRLYLHCRHCCDVAIGLACPKQERIIYLSDVICNYIICN